MMEDNFISQCVQTPCFLLDERELSRGIREFYKALNKRFTHSHIGYSMKTNSLPYAIKKARECGCLCEVVSDDELELALLCGYSLKNIVFNGPMKSKQRFLEAIQGGAMVNIETHRELEWLKDLPKSGCYPVGIRLSVNISDISPEDADGDDDFSRFGFNDNTTEFADAVKAISSIKQVRLAGLHVHRTSHSRSVRFYHNSVSYAASVIKKYDLRISYLDVGGGYFGIFRNAPTFEEYASAIHDALKEYELQNLVIIVEPGNALTASAFSYYSKVIDVKRLPKCRILTTDGSRNDIDPFFRKTGYLKEITRQDAEGEVVPLQIVAGATCLEYDQLFRIENEVELNVGDIIKYNNVGAYTLTLTPNFINYLPRVYAKSEEGEVKLVRDKWSAKEIITKSTI